MKYLSALLLFSSLVHAQVIYPTICSDDPDKPGWRVCQYYQNFGPQLCDGGAPNHKIHYRDMAPTGAQTLWVTKVVATIHGPKSHSLFNTYAWYTTGQYSLCMATDALQQCTATPPSPGVWQNYGDWLDGFASCEPVANNTTYNQFSIGVTFRYKVP